MGKRITTNKQRKYLKAQVTLELVFAFILAFLLLFRIMKAFFWITNRLANRYHLYDSSRTQAASLSKQGKSPVMVENLEPLDFFDEGSGSGRTVYYPRGTTPDSDDAFNGGLVIRRRR